MKLLLAISSLSTGGSERVISNMANHWAANGWDIVLLTTDNGREPPFYPLHPSVEYINQSLWSGGSTITRSLGYPRSAFLLRRMIQSVHPQCVISFSMAMNIRVLVSLFGSKIPVVISERSDPMSLVRISGVLWRLRHAVRSLTYPLASQLVVQSPSARLCFSARLQSKTVVIPNPVAPPSFQHNEPISSKRNGYTVIAVSRLAQEKQLDLLLEAFAQISQSRPDWSLVIWGDGPERTKLEALRSELNLDNKVLLPGRTTQVMERMREADLFVLSSRFEGFPNALCEAMSCGLPVISFECSDSISQIVRDGVDGILVMPGDVNALAAAMARLMDNPKDRQRLASRAREIVGRFELEKIMNMWETMLADVTCRPVN